MDSVRHLVGASFSNKTSQTTCNPPFLHYFSGAGSQGVGDVQSFCLADCCIPCPPQETFFGKTFNDGLHTVDWINMISLGLCILLLISFVVLPSSKTYRNHYLVGITLSFATLHATNSFVATNYKATVCSDTITMATQFTSSRCFIQGAMFIWGLLASIIWLGLRMIVLHLQIVYAYIAPAKAERFVVHFIGWGIPTIFTTVALAMGKVRFELGHVCGPTISDGLGLLWIPLMIFAAPPAMLHLWTLTKIATVMQVATRVEPMEMITDDKGNMSISSVPRYEYRKAGVRDIFLMQWRSIFITLFCMTVALYYGGSNVILFNQLNKTAENVPHIIAWLTCGQTNNYNFTNCTKLAKNILPIWRSLSADALRSVMGVVLFVVEARRSFWRAWSELVVMLYRKALGKSHAIDGWEHYYHFNNDPLSGGEGKDTVVDGMRIRTVLDENGRTTYEIFADEDLLGF
ncbi:hypothetical protein NEOLI_002632 [Neolecta irregularis DAH-3]|uniref:G-protein coupled receptors family 2 profile 2 domain-containing protein n=1 Tax=Neolecta irregularis (strain DAH-3) TaxID=1198029 RepID=A0A1U7LQE6_NEOID|nr:hypothetical protein NEOLI_002632 [Neolecta irregularis DAH-3]|eukprot:OLL24885.1 hypothetical protein NEOLI_002632 [Neolecta irregularis DAH-3]